MSRHGTPLTKSEIDRNMRAVAHAIAQQELEGLKVSEATIEDMQRAARGELSPDDVIRNIHARVNDDGRITWRLDSRPS